MCQGPRLSVGDWVRLSVAGPEDGCLKRGDTGRVVSDRGVADNEPYKVENVESGETKWYRENHLVAGRWCGVCGCWWWLCVERQWLSSLTGCVVGGVLVPCGGWTGLAVYFGSAAAAFACASLI